MASLVLQELAARDHDVAPALSDLHHLKIEGLTHVDFRLTDVRLVNLGDGAEGALPVMSWSPRTSDHIVYTSTANVVTLMPPLVEPEQPPTNINRKNNPIADVPHVV